MSEPKPASESEPESEPELVDSALDETPTTTRPARRLPARRATPGRALCARPRRRWRCAGRPRRLPASTPPRRWVAKWLKEEAFWRDLFKTTIGAFIAIGASFVVVGVTGLITNPEWQRNLDIFLVDAVIVLFYGIAVLVLFGYLDDRLRDRIKWRLARWALGLLFFWLALWPLAWLTEFAGPAIVDWWSDLDLQGYF